MKNEVILTRCVSFSSGHRYWNAALSPEENRALFGQWASPYNHGHNYILEVSVAGMVNPDHGMVINIKDIDEILQKSVVKAFDQKSINDEVEAFRVQSPTLENLLQYFRHLLLDSLPQVAHLTRLRLIETPTLWAEWTENNMITITRTYEFSASHRLDAPNLSHEENLRLFGKCNNPNGHGHNYLLEVTVSGPVNPESGMSVDLSLLDQAVHAAVVDRYDHKNLNQDLPEFAGKNPTSEVVAQQIFATLSERVPGKLERIKLHETARNIFEVSA